MECGSTDSLALDNSPHTGRVGGLFSGFSGGAERSCCRRANQQRAGFFRRTGCEPVRYSLGLEPAHPFTSNTGTVSGAHHCSSRAGGKQNGKGGTGTHPFCDPSVRLQKTCQNRMFWLGFWPEASGQEARAFRRRARGETALYSASGGGWVERAVGLYFRCEVKQSEGEQSVFTRAGSERFL